MRKTSCAKINFRAAHSGGPFIVTCRVRDDANFATRGNTRYARCNWERSAETSLGHPNLDKARQWTGANGYPRLAAIRAQRDVYILSSVTFYIQENSYANKIEGITPRICAPSSYLDWGLHTASITSTVRTFFARRIIDDLPKLRLKSVRNGSNPLHHMELVHYRVHRVGTNKLKLHEW